MKNKIKTWGMMLKFKPPNQRVGILSNRKRCSAAAEPVMCVCVCVCVCVRERERDHCFCAQILRGLK